MLEPHQLARRATVVRRRRRILRGPLQQDRVVRVRAAVGLEVDNRRHVRRIGVGVELAEARSPRTVELRMKREALKSALVALRVHVDAPLRVVDVEVERDGLALARDRIQRTAHVVRKQAPRAGLVDEQHRPGGHRPAKVGQGRELDEIHFDDAVGGVDGRRKRIGGRLREHRDAGEQCRSKYSNTGHVWILLGDYSFSVLRFSLSRLARSGLPRSPESPHPTC